MDHQKRGDFTYSNDRQPDVSATRRATSSSQVPWMAISAIIDALQSNGIVTQ